jgi:hypothetical protein
MSTSFNITKTYQNRSNNNQLYVQNKIQEIDNANKQLQKNNKNVKGSVAPTVNQVFVSSTNTSGSRINVNQSSIADFY